MNEGSSKQRDAKHMHSVTGDHGGQMHAQQFDMRFPEFVPDGLDASDEEQIILQGSLSPYNL